MSVSAERMGVVDRFWVRWYVPLLVALWVFVPELRRLVDWQVGFNSLPVINLIPLVALLPLVFVCLRGKRGKFAHDFVLAAWLWAGAFGYSLLVGSLSGAMFGAAYEFALFALPLLAGLWLASLKESSAREIFDRFAQSMAWIGAITALYGLYQFVSPPPWDVVWVINSELGSIGSPEPFALRIFGTMNSPGVYADFLTMAILVTLHRLRLKTIWLIIPLLLCCGALVLTFVRTGWLELALGIVVYLVLSPRRGMAIATFGIAAALTVVLAMNLSLITGDPTSNTQLQTRISSFSDLQEDTSANAREQDTNIALHESLTEPLGQGLGTVGTSTKLSAAEATTVLDNGYLTRFLEMGVFGVLCYLASVLVALILSVARYRAATAAGDEGRIVLLATSIAIQVALIGAELSGDHHSALMGIVFWLMVGLTASIPAQVPNLAVLTPPGRDSNGRRPARA